MVAANSNQRVSSADFRHVPPVHRLAERVQHFFHQHPEVSREQFLVEAVQREIHFREQRELRRGPAPRSTVRLPLTAEDIRIHRWLNERLAMLDYERHGLWPRLRRFLFGNRRVK